MLAGFARCVNGVRYLFDFNAGYSPSNFCALNVAPEVVWFVVRPGQIRTGEQSAVQLLARIAPRKGFSPIANVRVDLSELGGAPNTEMFDDGTHGDEQAGDLTYSLNIALQPEAGGSKELRLKAVDRLGWEGARTAFLTILE
jgi:hypothetical protein